MDLMNENNLEYLQILCKNDLTLAVNTVYRKSSKLHKLPWGYTGSDKN